jgi:hypothetical protein
MEEISGIILALKDFDLYRLVTLLAFGILFYYLFLTHRETKEINYSVNHKQPSEKTLRETAVDTIQTTREIKDLLLSHMTSNTNSFNRTYSKLDTVTETLDKHEDRITKLEK